MNQHIMQFAISLLIVQYNVASLVTVAMRFWISYIPI